MTNCEEIERKAIIHLFNCSLDDNIFWMKELETAFKEVIEQLKKIGDERMTELDYKTHICLYYNMKCYAGDISVKGQYNFRKRG